MLHAHIAIVPFIFTCSGYWKTEDDGVGMAGLVAGDADAHPYVSFTINLI